jgi:hypothetical protein
MIKSKYIDLCEEHYGNPKSAFYNPKYCCRSDPFLKLVNVYLANGLTKVSIPDPENGKLNFIDNVLLVYSVLLLEVTQDAFFLDTLVKFIFQIRNYLNLCGWEHSQYLYNYGILKTLTKIGEYCSNNTTNQIPELINNFTSFFVYLEPKFAQNAKDFIDITENFCYWLYINNFSNYKIFKLE